MTHQPSHAPLIIVGTGRCGSTILHQMLARHPQLAFLVPHVDQNPSQPALNSLVLDWLDSPAGRNSELRASIAPAEAWRFWDHYVPGFSRPFRDLKADDVTVKVIESLHRVVPKLLTEKRTRLLVKLTGWTRIGFIKEVFPDAKVLHLVRDPRAVAASLLSVGWWLGWQGPEQWGWGPLSEEQQNVWLMSGQSFPVLAVTQWVKIIEAFTSSLAGLPSSMKPDILTVQYDRLCAARDEVLQEILSFAGLEVSQEYRASVSEFSLENRDYKWREDLTREQRSVIEQTLITLGHGSHV